MTHCIQSVCALDNYRIEACFLSGEKKHFDVKSLFSKFPQFRLFESERDLFESVKVDEGGYGISWNDELDLDAETIWDEGVLIEVQIPQNVNHLLAYRLLLAREQMNITQKELAEVTGIYQADISKIERGLGNPSLSTLKRLADGLNMELNIDFVVKK